MNSIKIVCTYYSALSERALLFSSAANWQTTIISLFTTAFVVFALYMKPDKKSREYIKAWRKCNFLVNSILYNKATFDNVASELEKTEDDLPSDED